jgi:hypothetical protein
VATKMLTAPGKVSRDVQSYLVEVSFLASEACQILSDPSAGIGAGIETLVAVRVAKCYKAEVRPHEVSIYSKFSMLLEDFSPSTGWYQTPLMSTTQLTAGIETLARFHAFFWNGGVHNRLLSDTNSRTVSDLVWPVATHWAPARQAPEMMSEIASIWLKNNYSDACTGFGDGSESHRNIGQRLEDVAVEVARECHFADTGTVAGHRGDRGHPHSTIIHGDAKAGNFFFNENLSHMQVGLIDFQWCGFGLGATDLAYYIASSAGSESLDVHGEKELVLLQRYHTVLSMNIESLQKASTVNVHEISIPTFEQLVKQYEAGLIDICRIAFSYHWGRIKASPQAFTPERQAMLGPCAYNKDTDVARWLVARCDALLTKRMQTQRPSAA